MKLILAILRDTDTEKVSQALVSSGLRVTRIASTGGFLRRGSSTLMIGVDDEKVENATQVIRDNVSPPSEPATKRATLFVINIEHYTQV
jgi:uncharacterized protein YaaQ